MDTGSGGSFLKFKYVCSVAVLAGFLTISSSAFATSEPDGALQWRVKLTAGFLDDSNVAIDEIDRDSSEGDNAFTWSARVGPKIEINDQVELRASASISDKSFSEFDSFDLTTSLFSLQASYKFADFKLGAGVRDITTDLASDKFLSNQQLYTFVTHRPTKQWFLRGELNFAEKEFEQQTIRDTSRESLGVDAYYFLDGTKKFWTFGLKLENEDSDTGNDQFSRNNSTLKARYSQTRNIYQRDVKFEGEVRYQSREYDAVDPRIGEIRDDDRFRLSLSAQVPISYGWYFLGEYEYSDYSSNLPSADYSQNLFAVKIGWEYE